MQLLEVLGEEMMEKRKEKKRKQEELLQFKKAQVHSLEETRAIKVATQQFCTHMKEQGKGPRIGGQRLSNGTTSWFCLYCNKEWNSAVNPLPPHLYIPAEHIGG